MQERPSGQGEAGSLARMFKIVAVVLLVIVAAIAVVAWISSGGDPDLPFDYDGFD